MQEKNIARVEEKIITEGNLDKLLNNMPQHQKAVFDSPEGRNKLISELINQELLYLDAVSKKMNEEESFKKEVENFAANYLKQYYLDKILKDAEVTDEEALDYYERNKVFFETGKQIRASHILVDEEEVAKEILEKIKSGETFESLVSNYSNCPSKEKDGDLGFFGAGQMVKEFEIAAFDLKNDEITESPIQTQFGYHIIKKTGEKDSEFLNFEEVKDAIKEQLTFGKQNKVYEDRITELKSRYKVEIY